MKTIALYLPQFHRIKENDEWWGEGFTEWIAVKNARPLFAGHEQPKVPSGDNYYNLLEHDVMAWQEKLMKKYGIDGLCIYHYWFENGKKILEKPAENLLMWKDLHIPFCFSWANETWARTWSNINHKNIWTSEFEPRKSEGDSGILLNQKYGKPDMWRKHFEYLLPFFEDSRYIKIDGKPVFVFYKVSDIYCFENMIEFWNGLAISYGFNGIYAIGNKPRKSQVCKLDKVFISEPGDAMQKCQFTIKNGVMCYDYDDVWNTILNEEVEDALLGAFVNYDDTPRRGMHGTVIEGFTEKKFQKYMQKLINKNLLMKNELLFINAWNEWGEGMYLEPDCKMGEGYLNSIKKCSKNERNRFKKNVSGAKKRSAFNVDTKLYEESFDKEKHLRVLLDKWMELHEKGLQISDIFEECINKRIAIYGNGVLGRHLIADFRKSGIVPEFVIDRNKQGSCEMKLYSPEEDWPEVDMIIVTATYEYGYIYRNIRKKNCHVEIVSLAYILMEN